MAQNDLEIVAKLQDLVSDPLRKMREQLAQASRATQEISAALGQAEQAEKKLSEEVKKQSAASREALRAELDSARVRTAEFRTRLAQSQALTADAQNALRLKQEEERLSLLSSRAAAESLRVQALQAKAQTAAAQAQKKSQDDALKATQSNIDKQDELRSVLTDLARGLGINLGPLQGIIAAATPIAGIAAAIVGIAEAISFVNSEAKKLDESLKPAFGRATAADIAILKTEILDLAKSTGIAADELGAGVAAIFTNTTARGQTAVSELLKQSALLSKVGFGSVAEAASGLDGVLDAFSLKVADSSRAAALLATSADRAGAPIKEFAASLEQAGPLARQFGLSIEDVSALLVSIKDQGVGLGAATNAIRSLLAIFSEEGNQTRKALEGIGINFASATRDGQGFARILGEIAKRTEGQPELLNTLFGGNAQQLTRVFAAVQGAANGFEVQLQNTSRAAQDFEEQSRNAAENSRKYWSAAFNAITAESIDFANSLADSYAVATGFLLGDLDKARAEYAAFLQRQSESGIPVRFFVAEGITQEVAQLIGQINSAVEQKSPEAVIKVVGDFETFQSQVDAAVKQLATVAARRTTGFGTISAERVGESPLANLLKLTEADSRILRDSFRTLYDNLSKDAANIIKVNVGGITQEVVNPEILQAQFEELIRRTIPAVDRLPAITGAAIQKTNEELSKLGAAFGGQAARLKIEGDRIALVFEDIAGAAQEASLGTERQSQKAFDTAKARIEARNKQEEILSRTLPANVRRVAELEKEIAQNQLLIAQYSDLGISTKVLEDAIYNLREEQSRLNESLGQGQKAFGASAADIAAYLSPVIQAAKGVAQLAAELTVLRQRTPSPETETSLDARDIAEERIRKRIADQIEETARIAQQEAEKFARSESAVLQLAFTTELEFQRLQTQELIKEALIPLAEEYQKLSDLQAAGAISSEQYAQQLSEIRKEAVALQQSITGENSFSGAFSNRIAELQEQFTNTAAQGREFADNLASGFNQAFDSLISNLLQGQASLRDFGKTLALIVAQALARIFALKAASSVLGFFSGGSGAGDTSPDLDAGNFPASDTFAARGGVYPGRMLGSSTPTNEMASKFRSIGAALKAGNPVKSYAMGGIATRPQVAVFGEGGGAEAFVPLPGPNRGIPVEFRKPMGIPKAEAEPRTTSVNVTLNVGSLDPRTAADVVLAQMPAIQSAIASAINKGQDRALLGAVRGAMR